MTVFNSKQLYSNLVFTCKNCGESTVYKTAYNGCPDCGYDLFKVATRSGTPSTWDKDRQEEDPYLRQKRKAIDPQNGGGYRLNIPFSEDDIGGSQLGSRMRGALAPRDFSTSSDEYDGQMKRDVPGSHDDLLSNPPMKTDLGDWFADPEDTLSVSNLTVNEQKGQPKSIENNLGLARLNRSRVPAITDDNIFSRVSKRLKGVRR
jgi:predicted  nucleic acid-binding Zn-ribbon protein